jgi:hypothetical protein
MEARNKGEVLELKTENLQSHCKDTTILKKQLNVVRVERDIIKERNAYILKA